MVAHATSCHQGNVSSQYFYVIAVMVMAVRGCCLLKMVRHAMVPSISFNQSMFGHYNIQGVEKIISQADI